MAFASRIPGSLEPNRLAEAVRQRRSEGLPIIDLTDSNPTRVGLEYPNDLLAPLANCRGLTYSPQPLGLIEARRAVAADYGRRGVVVDPRHIALTSSTSEAYSHLFKLLTSSSDEILVPRPTYPLFEHLTALDGVVARAYDLEYHGTWSIDFESVERAAGPRTRAVLVVHPNNPTGSFVSSREQDRLATICARRNIALIADEVFADYQLESGSTGRAGSMAAREDVLVFALGGLSKAIGLPQVKLGWIAVGGPDRLVSQALEKLELVCDTYLSVSTPVQLALPELLERGAGIRAQIAARIAVNHRRLNELTAQMPSCRALHVDAGWSAVVQVPTFRSEEDLVLDLLSNDGVLTYPGYFFDFPRESYLVVSLLPAEATFEAGVTRMLARATQAL